MKSVRLYGRANGNGSHAQVTRGFRLVLEAHGLLAGFVGIDQDDPFESAPGATADVGIFTGPLGALPLMERGARHEHRLAMIAPNSDRIPPSIAKQVAAGVEPMVPSHWAAHVLSTELPKYGVNTLIEVLPHGVLPEFRRYPALRQQTVDSFREGHFLVVHLSTSERQRKGTAELVTAWRALTIADELPRKAHLVLILDMPAFVRATEWMAETGGKPDNVELVPRPDLSAEQMAQALSTSHLVCQPSRGEAFGLVPLEARACGVPVVATTCTGHSEHLAQGLPGFVRVAHGPMAPIDDLVGSSAPSVAPADVAAALRKALARWPHLERDAALAAEKVQQDWSWERQLGPLLDNLKGT